MAVALLAVAGTTAEAQPETAEDAFLQRCLTQNRRDVQDKLGQTEALLRATDALAADVADTSGFAPDLARAVSDWWRGDDSLTPPPALVSTAPEAADLLLNAARTRAHTSEERRLLVTCLEQGPQPPRIGDGPRPRPALLVPQTPSATGAAGLGGGDCLDLYSVLAAQPRAARFGVVDACLRFVAIGRSGSARDPAGMLLNHPGVCESALVSRSGLMAPEPPRLLTRFDTVMDALCP
jgi:hypothetical protein